MKDKLIKFYLEPETYAKIRELKTRKMWSWEDCVEELIKRCKR